MAGISTEFTQRLNNYELLEQVRQQYRTFQQAKQQFDFMVRQSQNLKNNIQDKDYIKLFTDLYGIYKTTDQMTRYGKELTRQYEKKYPSYSEFMRRRGYSRDQFSEWDSRHRQNIQAALSTVGLSRGQAMERWQMMRNLQLQNQGQRTRTALIQSSNDIAIYHATRDTEFNQVVRSADFYAGGTSSVAASAAGETG